MASNLAGHVLTAPFNKSVKVTGHHSEKGPFNNEVQHLIWMTAR